MTSVLLCYQVLKKIAKFIQEQNEKIYAPQGLLLTDPIERGLRVVSFCGFADCLAPLALTVVTAFPEIWQRWPGSQTPARGGCLVLSLSERAVPGLPLTWQGSSYVCCPVCSVALKVALKWQV